MSNPTKDQLRRAVISLLRTLGAPQSVIEKAEREILDADFGGPTEPAQEAPKKETADVTITKSEAALLSTLAEGLTELHDHLCPRIKALRTDLNTIDANNLQRHTQLRDSLDVLTKRVDTQRQGNSVASDLLLKQQGRIEALEVALAALTVEFRKQAGLLHRRVTKRKQEVRTVATKAKRAKLTD